MKRFLSLIVALAIAFPAAAQTGPTWVILVRHAEKAATPANDPPLTAEGQARALALAGRLAHTRLSAIITTQFERTRATAAPTAAQHRLTPIVVPSSAPNHAQAVADEVRKHAGGVVLVVGHSNTVPAIVAALGAPQPKPICDSEYDNLFIVSIPSSGAVTVTQARFGLPSPADAGCGATMK